MRSSLPGISTFLNPESTWLSMSLPLTEKEEAYEATRKLLTQAAALT
jgi:hypothetical protein